MSENNLTACDYEQKLRAVLCDYTNMVKLRSELLELKSEILNSSREYESEKILEFIKMFKYYKIGFTQNKETMTKIVTESDTVEEIFNRLSTAKTTSMYVGVEKVLIGLFIGKMELSRSVYLDDYVRADLEDDLINLLNSAVDTVQEIGTCLQKLQIEDLVEEYLQMFEDYYENNKTNINYKRSKQLRESIAVRLREAS